MIEVLTYELPSFWAPYLINGDDSGLDESDIDAINRFCESEGINPGKFVSCSEDEYFTYSHDASAYCLGCNCSEFIYHA